MGEAVTADLHSPSALITLAQSAAINALKLDQNRNHRKRPKSINRSGSEEIPINLKPALVAAIISVSRVTRPAKRYFASAKSALIDSIDQQKQHQKLAELFCNGFRSG